MPSASAGLPMGEELYRGLKVGKYEVLTQLSAGGMAELFLCFTKGPGGFRKYVVVKRILPDAKENDHFVKMFLDEARITAAFNHPNVGQVYDLDSDEEGPYLAMEFIAGQNLNQVTSACARKRAVLPIGFSASVAHDMALALHYAHHFRDPAGKEYPVIHRDVAQKNIMVTYDGVVKLLDFGIAKARGSLGRTSVGTVKGTTGYMAPEQVKGDELDGRTDIFSLGVVLWEMVTGKRLFAGDTELDEMKMILSAPIIPPHQVIEVVPERLSDVIMRALARERADRFGTAKDMAKAMELACSDLMFDIDQRASFMRELFAEKMKATHALLESAGGELEKAAVLDAVKLIREDDGKAFPAPKLSPPGARPKKKLVTKAKPSPQEDEEMAALRIKQEAEIARLVGVQSSSSIPDTSESPRPVPKTKEQAPDSGSNAGNLVLAALIFFAAAGGVLSYKFIFNPDATPPPSIGEPQPPTPIPGAPSVPGKEAPNPVAIPGAQTQPTPSGTKPTVTHDPKPADPAAVPHGQGTLTLAVFPKAHVLLGKQVLGDASPMLTVHLPSGQHVLTLVGEDGSKHPLSVKIVAGKSTSFKLNLADVQ
ncbi:MAG: protein kinase [Myxococcaceae bacterium]